ncbi:restriction endonuclease [Terribacillus saccharophilus]|uniref:restriction endonuclease n=1 Tax=Terribacillus saccharophilus TaxID=361277 RepID=UPI003D2B5CC2
MRKTRSTKDNEWWKQPSNIIIGYIIFISLSSTDQGVHLIVGLLNLIALAALVYFLYRISRKKKEVLKNCNISEIDKMNGLEFEMFLVPLFEKLGYIAKVTKGSGDYGADLLLEKKQKKFVVQAKRYSKTIGVSAVQEAVAAIRYYNANGAMVITNNYFTPAAENLANANKVRLLDRDELIYMINNEPKIRRYFIPSLRRYFSNRSGI